MLTCEAPLTDTGDAQAIIRRHLSIRSDVRSQQKPAFRGPTRKGGNVPLADLHWCLAAILNERQVLGKPIGGLNGDNEGAKRTLDKMYIWHNPLSLGRLLSFVHAP